MRKTLLIGTAAVALGAYLQDNFVKKTNYLVWENVPEAFDGFKICHLSDFHDSGKIIQNQILKIINKENPDIIIFSGDLVHTGITENSIDFMKKLREICPVYFVSGNHDAKPRYYLKLINGLRCLGIKCLENSFYSITKNGESINIIGLTDPDLFSENEFMREIILRQNMKKVEWDKNKYSILVCHRPEFMDLYESFGVNLAFTGHAHGGQWRIPFIDKAVYCPDQGIFPKYTEGIIEKEKIKIIINRGIGNKAPVPRINNYPEVVICEIKKALD